MSDDLLSRLTAESEARKSKSPQTMSNPIRASAAARVRTSFPKSRQAGQYVRVTATLLPETLEALAEMQRELSAEAERVLGIGTGIRMTDVLRLAVTAGLAAWREGRLEVGLEARTDEPTATLGAWSRRP